MSDERELNKGALALKAARTDNDVSQQQVATACEVEQPTVARWEAAVWKPKAAARGKLMEHYGIPWQDWDTAVPG